MAFLLREKVLEQIIKGHKQIITKLLGKSMIAKKEPSDEHWASARPMWGGRF
jgi:hypothetical protein